jgi:hypothetical protein
LRASFIGSDCLLDRKGLLKARNAMVHGYERKGNSQAQKGVCGFQRLRININYSSILFLLLSL